MNPIVVCAIVFVVAVVALLWLTLRDVKDYARAIRQRTESPERRIVHRELMPRLPGEDESVTHEACSLECGHSVCLVYRRMMVVRCDQCAPVRPLILPK